MSRLKGLLAIVILGVAFGVAVIGSGGCGGPRPGTHADRRNEDSRTETDMVPPDVTPEQARQLLESDKGYVYLDVRTVSEFNAGRPAGAWNIPYAEVNPSAGKMEPNPRFLDVVRSRFPKDAKLIVGCKSGSRSASACQILRQAGFQHAHNMLGGFGGVTSPTGQITREGWSTLGFPVERDAAGERDYESLRSHATR